MTLWTSPYRRRSKGRRPASDGRAAKIARLGGRCAHCGSTDDLTLDHIIPKSLAPGLKDNLQVLCRPCNAAKGDRLPDPVPARFRYDAVRGWENDWDAPRDAS